MVGRLFIVLALACGLPPAKRAGAGFMVGRPLSGLLPFGTSHRVRAILAFFSKRALFLASPAPAVISPALVSAILVS